MEVLGKKLLSKAEIIYNDLLTIMPDGTTYNLHEDDDNPAYTDFTIPEKPEIYLHKDFSNSQFTNSLLHEMLHVKQRIEKFPIIKPIKIPSDKKDKEINQHLNAFILDLQVIDILKEYDLLVITGAKKTFEDYSKIFKDKNNILNDKRDRIKISIRIANWYIVGFSKQKLESLITKVIVNHPDIPIYVQQIIDTYKNYDYCTPKGCEDLLLNLLEIFGGLLKFEYIVEKVVY